MPFRIQYRDTVHRAPTGFLPLRLSGLNFGYAENLEESGGGRMVNLWIDKDGSMRLKSRRELTHTKSNCASMVNNGATDEGVFSH